MNRRTDIRNTLVQKIKESGIQASIFRSRRLALEEAELPSIVISIDSEQNEPKSEGNRDLYKTAQASIEIIIDEREDKADEKLDTITASIESALHEDESFSDLIHRCILKNTEMAFVREGELELALARMNFEISYFAEYSPKEPDYTKFSGPNIHLRLDGDSHVR